MTKAKNTSINLIQYCPGCGHSLSDPRSILNEYWVASDVAYSCWCRNCDWKGEIMIVSRVVAYEPSS